MSKQRYVSFFQSPSTGMRRAIIWSGLPKRRLELKVMVVDQIAQNNLPQDSILGDVMLIGEEAVDTIQEWQMYRAGLDEVYQLAIDSMKMPKSGNSTFYEKEPEANESGFVEAESKLNYTAMEVNPYSNPKVSVKGKLKGHTGGDVTFIQIN